MKTYSLLGTTAVLLTAILLAPVSAAVLSQKDAITFRNCMLMKADEAFQNQGCRTVMRKVHVTKSDLVMMQSCEAQTSETPNPDCEKMAAKHPDLARGHGMDDDH